MRRHDTTVQGFGVPIAACDYAALDASLSSYTQAGPRAGGVAVPDDTSAPGVIEVLGEQSTSHDLEVVRGGMPSLRGRAEVAVDGAGWERPSQITGWTTARWTDEEAALVDALRLDDGRILVAWRVVSSGAGRLRIYDPIADSWGTEINAPVGDDAGQAYGAALARMPDGRVLYAFHTGSDYAAGGGWEVWRSVSADPADGWVAHARTPFSAPPDEAAARHRLLYLPSGDLVFFQLVAGEIHQWASTSEATRLDPVDSWDSGLAGVGDACELASGRIGVVAIDSGTDRPVWTRLGSAFELLTSPAVQVAEIPVPASDDIDAVWCWADDSGRVYVLMRVDGVSTLRLAYSDDEGESWTEADGEVYNTPTDDAPGADNTWRAGVGRVVPSFGRAYLVAQFTASTHTDDDGSIVLIGLGGWSSRTLGEVAPSDDGEAAWWSFGRSAEWSGVALPLALPDDLAGWAESSAGSPFVSLDGGWEIEMLDTSSAVSWIASDTTQPTAMIAEIDAQVMQAEAGAPGSIRLAAGNGTAGRIVDLSIGVGAVALSLNGAAAVDLVDAGLTVRRVVVRVVWTPGARLRIWWRPYPSTTWTSLYDDAGPSGTVASAVLGQVEFGPRATSAAAHLFFLYGFRFATTSSAAVAGAAGLGGSLPLRGRPLTALPAALPVAGPTYVRAKDGPFRLGDEFASAPAYDYPAAALDVLRDPSPRVTWRSTGTTETIFAWALADGDAVEIEGAVGLLVAGANFASAVLEGSTDGGATWAVTLATWSASAGLSALDGRREGRTLRPRSGTTATRYLWRGELVGGTVVLSGSPAARILAQTEGAWADHAARVATLTLDEQATANVTATLWRTGGLAIGVRSTPAKLTHIRVRIPSGATLDGYQTASALVPVRIVPVGKRVSRGRLERFEIAAEDNGERRRQLAPARRVQVMSWVDGMRLGFLRGGSPDWLGPSAGPALANRDDVARVLSALIDETRSGEVPVVGVLDLPLEDGQVDDPTLYQLGRLVSDVSIEHFEGEEGSNELVRVTSINLRGLT